MLLEIHEERFETILEHLHRAQWGLSDLYDSWVVWTLFWVILFFVYWGMILLRFLVQLRAFNAFMVS